MAQPLRQNIEPQLTVIRGKHRSRLPIWIGLAVLIFLLAVTVAAKYAIDHAEPIMRARVIETLTARFHSRVELDGFHVDVSDGIQVSGEGLRIYRRAGDDGEVSSTAPVIAVKAFQFHTSVKSLLRSPMHVRSVKVQGLELNIPPKNERNEMPALALNPSGKPAKVRIIVDRIECDQTMLLINSPKPDKPPLDFEIRSLVLRRVGGSRPMKFDTVLVNAKPVGEIQSSGDFGPWNADSPRDTPVAGNYTFSHADLSTLKGIGGMLSSAGRYSGDLGNIVVDGETDTPDFRLDISGQQVPLHTKFHAIVDGTNGDTYLEPVQARLGRTPITAKGHVIRLRDHGHEIKLDVTVGGGRIEDLLQLAVRTTPPVMNGQVSLKTRFDLKPGKEDIAQRLMLSGTFHILGAHFSNEHIQQRIDGLSLRTQGEPQLLKQEPYPDVASEMSGDFALRQAVLTFGQLQFAFPGAQINLTGLYSLDGNTFDFHGKVRTEAKLSQMVTGKKRIFLKAVNPFFSKNGAGTEVPVKITGTKSEPHFGLDFHHKDDNNENKERPSGTRDRW